LLDGKMGYGPKRLQKGLVDADDCL